MYAFAWDGGGLDPPDFHVKSPKFLPTTLLQFWGEAGKYSMLPPSTLFQRTSLLPLIYQEGSKLQPLSFRMGEHVLN